MDEVFSFHPSKIGNSALIGFNVLQTKLQIGSAVVGILFDAVAGVKNLTVGHGGPVFCQAKSDGVHGAIGGLYLHFQVAILKDFGGLIGFQIVGSENGDGISWAKRGELFEDFHHARSDQCRVHLKIVLYHWDEVFCSD